MLPGLGERVKRFFAGGCELAGLQQCAAGGDFGVVLRQPVKARQAEKGTGYFFLKKSSLSPFSPFFSSPESSADGYDRIVLDSRDGRQFSHRTFAVSPRATPSGLNGPGSPEAAPKALLAILPLDSSGGLTLPRRGVYYLGYVSLGRMKQTLLAGGWEMRR